MSENSGNLNDRLKWAVHYGDAAECRRLIAAGAGAPVSSCSQAESLIAAIRAPADQIELLDLLLHAGFDPNSVYDYIGDEYQQTPFVAAAAAGRLDLMEKLVAAGADIHWRSPTGANAASEALPSRAWQATRPGTQDRTTLAAWLTERGVQVDPLCRNSRRMLCWAASNPCSWPDVPGLLNMGFDASLTGWTPLMFRIVSGEATMDDASVVTLEETTHRDAYDRTPFLMAVAAGRQDLAEALLMRGSDLHARGWCGASALHLAARYDHPDIVAWLVERGMSVNIQDDHHHEPLRTAVAGGSVQTARALIAMGADIRATDDNGYRAIHEANSREMLELLLNAGAEVNDISGGGEWPLKSECEAGDSALVQFLLDRGAQPDLTATGETALFSAVRSDSLDCVRLLLDAGADVNATDVDGWTCLWGVRSPAMARLLLERGADPSIYDMCGKFPEDWSLPLGVTALYKKGRMGWV